MFIFQILLDVVQPGTDDSLEGAPEDESSLPASLPLPSPSKRRRRVRILFGVHDD